jgi:hypothetical protein
MRQPVSISGSVRKGERAGMDGKKIAHGRVGPGQALEGRGPLLGKGAGGDSSAIDPRLDTLADSAEFNQLLAEIGNSPRPGAPEELRDRTVPHRVSSELPCWRKGAGAFTHDDRVRPAPINESLSLAPARNA